MPVDEMTCFCPVVQHFIVPVVPENASGTILPSQLLLHHFRLNELDKVLENIFVVTTPSLRFHLLTSLLNAVALSNMLSIEVTFPTFHLLRSLLKFTAALNTIREEEDRDRKKKKYESAQRV